jgi:hypothetical protein
MELIGVLVEKVPRKGETHFSHFTNLDTVKGLNGSETTAHIICGFDQADITTGLDEVESQNHIGDATTDKRDRQVGTLRYKRPIGFTRSLVPCRVLNLGCIDPA